MFNPKEKAADFHQAAYKRTDRKNYKQHYHRKPAYFRDLSRYSDNNPILIATDWKIVNFIHRLKGICLLCFLDEYYDFTFLSKREVWLLYLDSNDFNSALGLAREMQLAGVEKITLVRLDSTLLGASNV